MHITVAVAPNELVVPCENSFKIDFVRKVNLAIYNSF